MRHTHKREIDGTLWTVNEFSATEGLRVLTKLTGLCGGPVAKAFAALPRDGSILDVDFSILGSALGELSSRLDEDEVVEFIKRILSCTLADGEECGGRKFDTVFQGRYMTLFKVLGFALEVNFRVPLGDWLQAGYQDEDPPRKGKD